MLLSQLPYNTRGVQLASLALFVLNILVFVTILAISMCRYILYPQALRGVIEDREQILSLPLIPMAYSTLINMITFVLVPLCISRVVIGGNSIGSGYWKEAVSERSAGGGCGKKAARKASAFWSTVSASSPGLSGSWTFNEGVRPFSYAPLRFLAHLARRHIPRGPSSMTCWTRRRCALDSAFLTRRALLLRAWVYRIQS
jgi:hypothetical protein